MSETPAEMLDRLGTDAMAWTNELIGQYGEVLGSDSRGILVGWFANAMAMAEIEGRRAGMMAQAGMVPPDTSADDTSWDSRNHPDRVAEYVPCDDPELERLFHPYGSDVAPTSETAS